MSDEGQYRATVRITVEDVTADQAREFFERLNGHPVIVRLSDGLAYEGYVEEVTPDG